MQLVCGEIWQSHRLSDASKLVLLPALEMNASSATHTNQSNTGNCNTTYDCNRTRVCARIFHNLPSRDPSGSVLEATTTASAVLLPTRESALRYEGDEFTADVVMRSMAVPGLFPSYQGFFGTCICALSLSRTLSLSLLNALSRTQIRLPTPSLTFS
jgi:hypothetical protein